MANPYELWDTHRFLGVFRDVQPVYQYWTPWFQNEIRSTDEYIDFEKMPIQNRKLAAFALPLARGKSVYDDRGTLTRFKPAYVKVEDEVDPLMPLTRRVGIDGTMSQPIRITPAQRRDLIKTAMAVAAVNAIERRWDWMAAKAIIDGKITLSGESYPTTLVDFGRAAGHTVTLGAGSRFGDAGVSIVDFFQSVVDTMTNAEFGAVPTRATMGGGVWAVVKKNAEFRDHMDINIRGGNITIERGIVSGEKIFKVGEMSIGGASGQNIELWVNNETFIDPETGASVRFLGTNQVVFTGAADAVMGYRAFGRIVDPKADYEAIPIFPRNWELNGDPVVEYITHKSAPLMVPINPNATFLANVLA